MEPSSAVMPEATLPPTRSAVSTRPSSRTMVSAVTRPALDDQMDGAPTADVGLAVFEGRAIPQAEQEVTLEQAEIAADRLGPARRVGQHARRAIGASQLQLGPRAIDELPHRPRH